MKLEKAIKILQGRLDNYKHQAPSDYLDAVKLGIEALKVIEKGRGYPTYIIPRQLPGETEE